MPIRQPPAVPGSVNASVAAWKHRPPHWFSPRKRSVFAKRRGKLLLDFTALVAQLAIQVGDLSLQFADAQIGFVTKGGEGVSQVGDFRAKLFQFGLARCM